MSRFTPSAARKARFLDGAVTFLPKPDRASGRSPARKGAPRRRE